MLWWKKGQVEEENVRDSEGGEDAGGSFKDKVTASLGQEKVEEMFGWRREISVDNNMLSIRENKF